MIEDCIVNIPLYYKVTRRAWGLVYWIESVKGGKAGVYFSKSAAELDCLFLNTVYQLGWTHGQAALAKAITNQRIANQLPQN